MSTETTTRALVPDDQRLGFLPDRLGNPTFVFFEQSVYAIAERLSTNYGGGYWEFFTLGKFGWYMAPSIGVFDVAVEGNGYEGSLSADAFGIVVTLFAMNGALNFGRLPDKPARYLQNAYYALKDYACSHVEAGDILAAID